MLANLARYYKLRLIQNLVSYSLQHMTSLEKHWKQFKCHNLFKRVIVVKSENFSQTKRLEDERSQRSDE